MSPALAVLCGAPNPLPPCPGVLWGRGRSSQRSLFRRGGEPGRARGAFGTAPAEPGSPCREGERWYRLRQVLNKRLLKPSEALLYADAIGEVVSDLMVRLREERSRSPSGVLVGDVANLLYRFALEGKRGGPGPRPRPAVSPRGSGCGLFPQGSPISSSRPASGA